MDANFSKNLTISAINEFKNFLFLGCTNGEISVALKSCLYIEKDAVLEPMPKDKYCLGKNYSCHTSFIDQIEISCSSIEDLHDKF